MEAVGVGDVLFGVSLVLWRAGGGYGLRKEDGREKVQSGRRAQVMVSWWGRKGTRRVESLPEKVFECSVQRGVRKKGNVPQNGNFRAGRLVVSCRGNRAELRVVVGFFFKYCQPPRWAMNLNLPPKDGNPLQLSRRERRERKKKRPRCKLQLHFQGHRLGAWGSHLTDEPTTFIELPTKHVPSYLPRYCKPPAELPNYLLTYTILSYNGLATLILTPFLPFWLTLDNSVRYLAGGFISKSLGG